VQPLRSDYGRLMSVVPTALPDVLLLEPKVFGDDRGFFYESYNRRRFREWTGQDVEFVQDNQSRSRRHVLRGLHYQIQQPQGKLVRCVTGEILDVVVDLRRSSPTFGKWTSFILSAEPLRLAWIPAGFAHGFVVRSDAADVNYKTTDYYSPEHERCIVWNDPQLAIDWQLQDAPVLSSKDTAGALFNNAEVYP
jgi:dTDP-4-dehydrorhamnose 3,5-epimerase